MLDRTIERAAVANRLVTCDIGGRATIVPIRTALGDADGVPHAHRAAERLVSSVGSGDTVVVTTGFPIPPTMAPETDGPPGAVAIARALDSALNANVVLTCEPDATTVCEVTARAVGLGVADRTIASEASKTISVEPFPTSPARADTFAEDLLSIDPAALIAVEKVGPNREGVYHNMAGIDVSDHAAKVDRLFDRADASITTIGVGDAGNEVGMGTVEAAVRDSVEKGDDCGCPCGAGIACAIGTDVLVPATVSNWGAYAIVVSLGLLTGGSLLHKPAVERRMLHAASRAGALDGVAGGTTAWCDGLPPAVHESVVRLLVEVTRSSVLDRGAGDLSR